MNIKEQMNDRLDDLARMFYGNSENDLEDLSEYGLELSYHDDDKPFWRYLLCSGGPTEGFKFFVNPDKSIYRIEFGSSYNDNGTYETIEITDRDSVIWDLAYAHFDITERDIP